MSPRVDAINRTVLALLGLVLVAGGSLGLALGLGAFGSGRAGSALLPDQVRGFAEDQPWFWWAVAAVCVVLALLGLRWLAAQLQTDNVGRLDLTTDDRDGLTTLHTGAVTDAVGDDAEGLRGVAGASAHLRGEGGRRLVVAVDLAEHADIGEVRRQLEDRTVARARQALDDPSLPVEIQLRPDASRTARRAPA